MPPVTLGTAGGLLAVALLASFIPARAATRIDPMVALRWESSGASGERAVTYRLSFLDTGQTA